MWDLGFSDHSAPLVEIQNQILGYAVNLTGTTFALHYRSDRCPGRRAAYSVEVPFSEETLRSGVKRVDLRVDVVGRHFEESFSPDPEKAHVFTWDGRDADNQIMQGRQLAEIQIGYVRSGLYPRREHIRWRKWDKALGIWDSRSVGLGGWTLSVHHHLDRSGNLLWLGDGWRRTNPNTGRMIPKPPTLRPNQATNGQGKSGRTAGAEFLVASEDGQELYVFDGAGRHLCTVDASSKRLVYCFGYDRSGFLADVTDRHGNTTHIERDAEAIARAIISADGHRNILTLDSASYLCSITNPAGENVHFDYSSDGLLVAVTDAEGQSYSASYDELGRLTEIEEPEGGGAAFSSIRDGTGSLVARLSPSGQESTYRTEYLPTGETRFVNSCCGGSPTVTVIAADENFQTMTFPDGVIITAARQQTDAGPRFVSHAPLLQELSVKTPAGLAMAVSASRSTKLADPHDCLSPADLEERIEVNGRTYSRTFDSVRNEVTYRTPAGRGAVAMLDEFGQVREFHVAELEPARFCYDARGRLLQLTQGNLTATCTYDAHGHLATLRCEEAGEFQYTHDNAGRCVQAKLPSGRTCHFAYDANGNPTQIVMPNGGIHTLGFTDRNSVATYAPPGSDAYSVSYSKERKVTQLALPSGRTVGTSYGTDGLIRRVSYPEAAAEVAFETPDRKEMVITRTPTNGLAAQTIKLVRDGALVTELEFVGAAVGGYRYSYDDDFFLTSVSFDDQERTELARDQDGLLTNLGPFLFTRDGPAGALTEISDGRLRVNLQFDRLGRLAVRTSIAAAKEMYELRLRYDTSGRIVEKTEALQGTTEVHAYAYDADWQLVETTCNGLAVERYEYDDNGNCISRHGRNDGTETLRHDAQDRPISRGDVPYQWDPDGFLKQRGNDCFCYSARGELLAATLADRTEVTYTHDAFGRRVARTDEAGSLQYLYGNLAAPHQITAVRGPTGRVATYYYDPYGRLFALSCEGAWYYVATDQIGTPRVVFDETGNPVKLLRFDSFGNCLEDSNPGFDLPVGFAGGLPDPGTGLVRFCWRDYDPAARCWTARDPLLFAGGQLNLYAYVGNNPVNYTDPLGLDFSYGSSVNVSTITPPTSLHGGSHVWGKNFQEFENGAPGIGTMFQEYNYSGKGVDSIGLDYGAAVEANVAWGSGSVPWHGPFHSVNINISSFTFSYFWSGGEGGFFSKVEGGWSGISFGVGLGLPGIAFERTLYKPCP